MDVILDSNAYLSDIRMESIRFQGVAERPTPRELDGYPRFRITTAQKVFSFFLDVDSKAWN